MKPVRSLLYVPANNPDWVASAPEKYDADAIIYDLEDAVPPDGKTDAREVLASAIPDLAGSDTLILVRVNTPGTGWFDADIDAVVRPELDALVIPKLPSVENVRRADYVLEHVERIRGLDSSVDLVLLPETAQALNRAEQLCSASNRVEALIGATSQGGDIEHALGFDWSRDGYERFHLLSKLVMDGRAAGLRQFIAGPWLNIEDLDGLRKEAEMVRQFGYTGYQVIHPEHIKVVNEAFTPDPEAVKHARKLVAAFEEKDTTAVFRFEGEMVDTAHLRRAEQLVERSEAFNDCG